MQPQPKQIPSPNFTTGRKNYRPEAIVIHIMAGSLSGTDEWFQNRASSVSAHYGIGKNGDIHQYVQEKDTAWHAGRVHAPRWNLIKSAGNGTYINPNYYTIGIEHEGNETTEWTEDMYNSCTSLVAEICKRWNIPIDRNHIIGHQEIYSLKTCPGFKVDLKKIVEQSRQKAGYNLSFNVTNQTGTVKTTAALRLRSGNPSTTASVVRVAPVGEEISYVAFTEDGQDVEGVRKWYKTVDECWFWGGAIIE